MMPLKIVFNHFNEPVEPFPARVFNGIPALDCTLRSELIILNGENQNSEKNHFCVYLRFSWIYSRGREWLLLIIQIQNVEDFYYQNFNFPKLLNNHHSGTTVAEISKSHGSVGTWCFKFAMQINWT